MSDKTTERLEQEAREALIAAELSAKMNQWRRQPPPPGRNGGNRRRFFLLLALLALGAAGWWFWPNAERSQTRPPGEQPAESPRSVPDPPRPAEPQPRPSGPVAGQQRSAPAGNRYLALARAHYVAPDFTSDLRGAPPAGEDALQEARSALSEDRFADALGALQNVPAEYQPDAAYLRGHALFGLKRYAQAAAVFRELTGSVRYGEAAQWYEALALLPDFERNRPSVLRSLNTIAADDGHSFQQEARRLVAALAAGR